MYRPFSARLSLFTSRRAAAHRGWEGLNANVCAVLAVFVSAANLATPVVAVDNNPKYTEELHRNADSDRRLAFVTEYIRELRNRGLIEGPHRKVEPARLTFVTEFIRELGVNDRLRIQREKEVSAAADPGVAIIRSNMRIVGELTAQASLLKGVRLNPPLATVPGNIAELYEQLINVHNKLIALGAAMGSESRHVHYEVLAADALKLAFMTDYVETAHYLTLRR
jgi:hypothetical protein